jgi:hypothetical protein
VTAKLRIGVATFDDCLVMDRWQDGSGGVWMWSSVSLSTDVQTCLCFLDPCGHILLCARQANALDSRIHIKLSPNQLVFWYPLFTLDDSKHESSKHTSRWGRVNSIKPPLLNSNLPKVTTLCFLDKKTPHLTPKSPLFNSNLGRIWWFIVQKI